MCAPNAGTTPVSSESQPGKPELARIALDAMGGDFAPQATVSGALLALGELDAAHTIQLVGPTATVEAELKKQLDGEHKALASHRNRLEIIEAPEVIGMD